MIYIKYGPPDEIEVHALNQQPASEIWHYRDIEGTGANILFEFIQLPGEYRLAVDPRDKDPLPVLPVCAPSDWAFDTSDFDRLESLGGLQSLPRRRFKDLEAAVSSNLRFNTLPIEVRTVQSAHLILNPEHHHNTLRSSRPSICADH